MQKGKPNTFCSYCNIPIHVWPKRLASLKNHYCNKEHYLKHQTKPFIVKKGYKKLLIPNHPRADSKGYAFEHIIILEAKLGRTLKPQEVTHHIDKNKMNNSPDNLEAVVHHGEHIKKYHFSQTPNETCFRCGKSFYRPPHRPRGKHIYCTRLCYLYK